MPRIVEFGGDPDLFAGDAGVDDALPDFVFVAVGECGIDVAVSGFEGGGDGEADFLEGEARGEWCVLVEIVLGDRVAYIGRALPCP